jgi:hypothetical protein
MTLDPSLTLREAAADHLAAEGLAADGGLDDRWVKTKIGPIPFAYPNTKGRKRLVAAHDLHHLLADYRTDIVGEAEMGAWELGSGLRDRTGVRLAIRVFGFALPLHRQRLLHAFVRGRHCQNLVGRPLDDATLDRSVAELRTELGLDRAVPPPSPEDQRAFRIWAAKALAIVWGPILPLAALAWWWWA